MWETHRYIYMYADYNIADFHFEILGSQVMSLIQSGIGFKCFQKVDTGLTFFSLPRGGSD